MLSCNVKVSFGATGMDASGIADDVLSVLSIYIRQTRLLFVVDLNAGYSSTGRY